MTKTKVKGTDVWVEVNTAASGAPVWKKVGGQRSATLSPSLEVKDITDKDSGGWEEALEGNRSLEIEFDCFLIEDDDGFKEMEKGFWSNPPKRLHLRLTTPKRYYIGFFRLTEMPIEAPMGDAATISFSIKADGPVTVEQRT